MLAISVTFLHGWLRSGSASDVRVTGQADPGEWPPSPARLFAAFVAADGTRDRCHVTDGSELELLESAEPPTIHACPPSQVERTQLHGRFVVENERDSKGRSVHEYGARKSTLVRPGTRLAPADPTVVFLYDDLDPTDAQFRSLQLRAARIGYLGAADAPARVTVSRDLPSSLAPAWRADDSGETAVALPFDGLVAVLDNAYDRFRAGQPIERSWMPQRAVMYASPDHAPPPEPTGQALWLRFDHAVQGHLALYLTEALRDAVLAHHPDGEDAPPILHGHGMPGSGWQQARYLPLVEVGHAFATGRIHGAAVWLPPSATTEEIAGVRTAVLAIRRLTRRSLFNVAVTLHDGARRPWAAHPARWTGPAKRWVSATPVVHERHGRVTDAEVAIWCAHAGLPEPVRWRLARGPVATGAAELRPDAVQSRYGHSPFSHLAIQFAEPIHGPIAIGKGRQFGLGMLAPEGEPDHG